MHARQRRSAGSQLRRSWMAIAILTAFMLCTPVLNSLAQVIDLQPVQPIQPLEPVETEGPDIRPGLIPTLDPDADLPTRIPRLTPTPTPRFVRMTPTPPATELPATEPAETMPTPTPETQALEQIAATVTIHKGICPRNDPTSDPFDPYDDHGIQDFIDACPLVTVPVEFDVFGSDGFEVRVNTGIGGEIQVGVPAGPLTVSEVLPDVVTVPAVFCFSDKTLLQADAPPTFATSVNWEAEPGEQVECWFFNIPDDSRFVIHKFVCPEGVSPLSDQLQPALSCTEQVSGVEFIVTDATGEHSQTTVQDDVLIWDDLEQRGDGTISVREVIPDGYGEPAYFCGDRQRLDVGEVFGEYTPSQNGEISLTYGQPGQPVDGMCVVFNTTVGAETGHDITILKLACPAGYDDTGLPIETIVAACPKFPGTVEFMVADDGGFSVTEQTIAPNMPFALFDDIPAGPITITETVPNGYTPLAVWCSDEYANETLTGIASQPLQHGNAIAWDYTEDARLSCVWLNVPTGDAPGGDNVMTVHKWRCNVEDTGPAPDWPVDNLLDTCTEAQDGVDFTLAAANGVWMQTTANGTVEWTGIAEGPFSIQEAIPPYSMDPVVYCSITIPNGGGPLMKVPSANGVVNAAFEVPGSTYTCHWFNIDLGESSLRIYKRACPDDLLYGGSFDHYKDECSVPMPNVAFDVTTSQGTVSGDTNFAGILVLSPIPPGPFTLAETIPAGYGEPIVFCQASSQNGDQQIVEPMALVDTATGVLNAEMPEFGHVDCWWFNMSDDTPAGDGEVEIGKWRCPDDATLAESNDWYAQNCVEPHDGVTFVISTSNGTQSGVTAGGTVLFTDIPAGTVGVQEVIPDGYGEPVVLCDVEGTLMRFPAPTGFVSRDLAPGGTVTCHVYNIPADSGDITIVKHTCVAGYDPQTAGAHPEVDCPEGTDGVEFTLDGPVTATAITGQMMPGIAFFGDLTPGPYSMTETVPAGISAVFVTKCTGHLMGELQPYPLSMDASVDIDLDAGESLTCHWYNVPETDGGTVTVIKYSCNTETFVSEVDCQIEEGGVTFDLLASDSSVIATATTDGFGRISWTGLAAGDYWLAEHDGAWCRIQATPAEGGDAFGVNDGAETVVRVWNCGGETGTPGDTPTKYPNTGVEGAEAAPLAMAWQQTAPQQQSRGFFTDLVNGQASWQGPFAILVPFILAVIGFRDHLKRGQQNRERREEAQFYAEAAAVQNRPAWMTSDAASSRTARPEWMSHEGSQADRPQWLSSEQGERPSLQDVFAPLNDAAASHGARQKGTNG